MSPRRAVVHLSAAAAVLAAAPLGGCYASNVVAREDRAVPTAELELQFAPATAADVQGLFGSVAIEGDAAASLRQVWYWFAPDGTYSGAALVDGDTGLGFQTLTGRFTVADGELRLDEAAPVRVEVAGEHLRLLAEGGTLLLRRTPLQ